MSLNIILASDDRGSNMLAIAAYSVIKNNPKNKLHFYIFHSDITKENIGRIKRLESKFSNAMISFVSIDNKTIKGIDITNENVSMPAYYRYLAPDILPVKEQKALCMDFDMLCLGDIQELYSTDLDDKYLGAVADYVVENDPFYSNFKDGIGLGEDDTYVNSGLLLMNIETLRKSGIMKEFWKNVRNKSSLIPAEFNVFADQTVTNITFKGKIKLLNTKYNVFTTALKHIESRQPLIVHFTGSYKPLTYRDEFTSVYDEMYYRYYCECMEIIGQDEGVFLRNTLKKLSKEAGENSDKLKTSEELRADQSQQLLEAARNIALLKERINELDYLIEEEHKSRNLLRNLLLNTDRNITNFLSNGRQDSSRGTMLRKVSLSAYKVTRGLGWRAMRAIHRSVLRPNIKNN